MKQELLAITNTPFVQRAQFFYYKTRDGSLIQIDICQEWQSPYMPIAATKLKDIPAGAIPYISAVDLIVFKIHSCGSRAQVTKKRTDATDAENLLQVESAKGPVRLTSAQQAIVEPILVDVVTHGTKPESWWRERLSLPAKTGAR